MLEPLSQRASFSLYFRSTDMAGPKRGAAGDGSSLLHSRTHPESDRLPVRPANPRLHLVFGNHRHRFRSPFGMSPQQDLEW